jgi:hypothetical protein
MVVYGPVNELEGAIVKEPAEEVIMVEDPAEEVIMVEKPAEVIMVEDPAKKMDEGS